MNVRGLIRRGMGRVSPGRALTYSPPALLCVIACAQIYGALAGPLSPWKGGGFGMFSTVDSPDARFLRIYLINGSEEIPVLVPDGLKTLARKTQTIPSRALLSELAGRMARGTWEPYRLTHPVQSFQAAQAKEDAAATDTLVGLTNSPPPADYYGLRLLPEAGKCSPDGRLIFTQLLRMREQGGPAPSPGEAVEFQRVRAELWRYQFGVSASRLKADKYLEVTVNAGESGNQ
jgi:hypothetical protein